MELKLKEEKAESKSIKNNRMYQKGRGTGFDWNRRHPSGRKGSVKFENGCCGIKSGGRTLFGTEKEKEKVKRRFSRKICAVFQILTRFGNG